MNTNQTSNPAQAGKAPAPSHGYYIFLIIYMAGLSAFGSFVNDMYLPCLPNLVKVFGCSVSMTQLSLTMGMIGLGAGEIIFGPVSDKWGRKPVLVIALILFCVAAAVSIFSRTIHFFLFCRLVQGLGGSAGYFLARTIPADIYGGRQLAKFMAIIGAINGLAPAAAPVLGGFMTDSVGWKGIFLTLAGIALILLAFCGRLKESLPPARRLKGNLWKSFGSYRTLLANRHFMIHVMLKGAGLGLLFAYISSAPFIIQTHYGYTPTQFGLFMGLNAICMGAGSMLALRFKLLKRAGFIGGCMLFATTVIEAAGMFLINNFWCYELLLLPMLFSLGMIFTVGNTLAMNEGRSNAGSASGLLGVFGYIFGAVVSPLVGMGDILHSSALVYTALAAIVLLFAFLTRHVPADLDKL